MGRAKPEQAGHHDVDHAFKAWNPPPHHFPGIEVMKSSSHSGFLPREGLYIDPIASGIKHHVLNPLWALPCFVSVFTTSFFPSLGWSFLPTDRSGPVFWLLGTVALLSILLHGNDYLSRRAKNNYVTDDVWSGNWAREVVVVTGAAAEGGIGSSIVKRLKQRKAKIIVLDILPMGYDAGSNVQYYKCDLSDSKAISHICATIRTEHGHPTVLINNAGISRGRTVVGGSYHDKDLTIRTNLLAPMFLMQECLPNMIKNNHGHIVGISSMSAHVPPGGIADYAASKAGLIALHESTSLEIARKAPKVRLSLLIASFIRTPLTKDFESRLNETPFMAPLLHVDTIGDVLADALYSGQSRDIYMPGVMRYFAGIRGWPQWLQCFIRNETTKILPELEENKKGENSKRDTR